MAPTITLQPLSQSVPAGTLATFSVQASGDPSPTYAWARSDDSGQTWNPISGATSPNYSMAPHLPDSLAQFQVTVTNAQGTAKSSPATLTVVPGVFAGGTQDGGTYLGYWLNGQWVNLGAQPGGWPTFLLVDGTDVYATGYYGPAPGYWKDGDWISLPVPAGTSYGFQVCAVAVSGEDIYVAGVDTTPAGGVAGVWKNGTWTALPVPPGSPSEAYEVNGLAVAGNQVDVVGAVMSGGTGYAVPALWSNGVLNDTLMGSSSASGFITAILLFGNDIYLAGWGSGSQTGPGYIMNGNWVGLDNPSGATLWQANALAVSGSDLYVGGWTAPAANTQGVVFYNPGYWRVGAWVGLPLPQSAISGQVMTMSILGAHVYAGGYVFTALDSEGVPSNPAPGYWLDGNWVPLPLQASAKSGQVQTLTVVP